MHSEMVMEGIAKAFEVVGVFVLSVGGLVALTRYALAVARRAGGDPYAKLRNQMGRAILLGLEILVAADIIRTVAVDPSVTNAITLGVIVLVRTFLSFSLEIELEGVAPWRRAALREDTAPN